jgi:hypothetical protein
MNNGVMKSNLYYARLHIKTGLEKYYRIVKELKISSR